ncbi:hypothetical protein K2173_027807 [Erythroxylum novogranatense]|uniref:Homeobox domain-containing protein n=1 Tax=Erythroxylum novogranatense TaxID=1862640 RepID=A0AAV8U084_9ROSI|nr:hypothetical protein K2173_027807 [Erythroxylum novogranatense]
MEEEKEFPWETLMNFDGGEHNQTQQVVINDGNDVRNNDWFGRKFVMTDDQVEMLRKQIAAYTAICDRLVDMHKSLSSQHLFSGFSSGMRLGAPDYGLLTMSGANRFPPRQRWNPRPEQLRILEKIFEEFPGTPSREKIKDITAELGKHGRVSENNVYNWFQNKRARSKRKQSSAQNNTSSEAVLEEPEADESAKDKKKKLEDIHQFPDENSELMMAKNMFSSVPEMGIDQLLTKTEAPRSCSPYWQVDGM